MSAQTTNKQFGKLVNYSQDHHISEGKSETPEKEQRAMRPAIQKFGSPFAGWELLVTITLAMKFWRICNYGPSSTGQVWRSPHAGSGHTIWTVLECCKRGTASSSKLKLKIGIEMLRTGEGGAPGRKGQRREDVWAISHTHTPLHLEQWKQK